MTSAAETKPQQSTGCYIYGLVPADVELTADAHGVGEPPAGVTVVRHGEIAALVSEIDVSRPLGKPEDLVAHEQLLDAVAADVPVLPMRFGAVMTDAEAVERELLAAHNDEFLAALDALAGRAEFVVRARFDEQTVLREVLKENPDAADLLEQIRGKDEDATRDLRVQLGELIGRAVEAKRAAATEEIVQALAPLADQHRIREPSHEHDAAHVAFLVHDDQRDAFAKAVEEIAGKWSGRAGVRLLGPLAAYDFVGQTRPGE